MCHDCLAIIFARRQLYTDVKSEHITVSEQATNSLCAKKATNSLCAKKRLQNHSVIKKALVRAGVKYFVGKNELGIGIFDLKNIIAPRLPLLTYAHAYINYTNMTYNFTDRVHAVAIL